MVEETKQPKKEKYSFSKLSSFHTCKYGYQLTYIEHREKAENAFAQYGSLVHSIMERYAKGIINLWDLVDVYKKEYSSAVIEQFPHSAFCNLEKLYYDQGIKFLSNFSGYDKYKIIAVEEEFELEIDDWLFTGIMDLLYEDENGRLILLDYKSKSSFKNKKERMEYSRQLYLYCLYIKQKYGRFPDELQFYMFRKEHHEPFDFVLDSFNEALSWAKTTVKQIRDCQWFFPTCDEFFGENLCNNRKHCQYKCIAKNKK